MGRKDSYTQKIADEICERIAQGEPLRQICRDEGMPAWRTVYDWINKYEDFSTAIARARELGYDAIAEETLDIADEGTNDWMEKLGADGQPIGWQLNGEHVQRSKLRIETRLKLLAKWSPKKYGDKQQVEMSGQLATSNMTEEEIRAELAALTNAGIIKPTEDSDNDVSDLL